MGQKIVYGSEDYESYITYQNDKQLANGIKLLIEQGCSIIEWNNEPDPPVGIIRQVINDMGVQNKVKLVVDCHDLDSVRRGMIPIPERRMMNAADGMLFPSLPIEKAERDLHKLPIPTTTIYSYCNKGVVDVSWEEVLQRKNMVYEGGVNPPNDEMNNTIFKYRNLFPIFKQIVEMGNEVHVFCGNISAFNGGQYFGAVLYVPTEYNEMMQRLTKFKYGLVLFNNKEKDQPQVDLTLTNKAQEYLQAGLPSLACWCAETEKWITKHKIGFVFNDITDIRDMSHLESQYLSSMENIRRKRNELVMENFIHRVENLYADLLGTEKKGIPKNIQELEILEYST